MNLDKGDLLLVYTDGITEAMNSAREEYGEEKLLSAIKRYKSLPTSEFADRLMEDIKDFTGGTPQSDDITFLVIRDKEKYTELQYQKRSQLFDLIEKKGYTVGRACKEIGISKSTYYRLKRLREEKGDEALLLQSKEKELGLVDLDISQKILAVVMEYPEYSAKRIGEVLKEERYGSLDLDATLIYRELRKLKISTKEKRIAYIKRKGS